MILAGANMLRLNLTYYKIDEIITYLKNIQEAAEKINSKTEILIDLPINKIRLGDFNNKILSVKENDHIIFKSASYSPDYNDFVPVNFKKIGEKLYKNDVITLANGRIAIQVIEIIDNETIKIKVLNNGVIKTRQTLNNTHFHIDSAQVLNSYRLILEKIAPFSPNKIAISYYNNDFLELFKKLDTVRNQFSNSKFIIKIEKEITNTEIENLCRDPFVHMIVIDRGEMGVNMPFEKVGISQKNILNITKKYNKPVIISTQILDSTIDNYIPTRSNISDLTNIILDGAAGIILTKETDYGRRPSYSIAIAKKIINEVLKYKNIL